MNERVSTEDLLDLIEGEPTPSRAEAIRAAVAADPELSAWVERVRADKARLHASSLDLRAPEGLVEDAIAAAERGAILGDRSGDAIPIAAPRQSRRFRITPMRMSIAAAIMIAAGTATILPVILGVPGRPGIPAAPGGAGLAMREEASSKSTLAMELDEADGDLGAPERALAMADATDNAHARRMEERVTSGGASAALSGATPVSGAADEIVGAAPSEAKQAQGGVTVPGEVDPAKAAALAMEGRVALLIVGDAGGLDAAAPAWTGGVAQPKAAGALAQTLAQAGLEARASGELALAPDAEVFGRAVREIESAGLIARFIETAHDVARAVDLTPGEALWWFAPDRGAMGPTVRVPALVASRAGDDGARDESRPDQPRE